MDSAKALYEKGQDAEARQNYEQAFDYFKQAYNAKAEGPAVSSRVRAQPASMRLPRTCIADRFCAMPGKLEEALAEFQKALEIDPSSFIAQQELKRTQQMIKEGQNPQPQASDGRCNPHCAGVWNRRRDRWNWLPFPTLPSP